MAGDLLAGSPAVHELLGLTLAREVALRSAREVAALGA
jgi:hypothetical protein